MIYYQLFICKKNYILFPQIIVVWFKTREPLTGAEDYLVLAHQVVSSCFTYFQFETYASKCCYQPFVFPLSTKLNQIG